MQINERARLLKLTTRAISINKELLAEERKFADFALLSTDIPFLSQMNEKLNDLVAKEHLYLAAAKSLLQIMAKRVALK